MAGEQPVKSTATKPSGYVMTLEAHQERMEAQRKDFLRRTNELWCANGALKNKVRELVAVRLAKPGTDDEQRVWDELMELVNDD